MKTIHDKYKAQVEGRSVSWTSEELACENFKLVDRCYKKCGQIYERSNDAKKNLERTESREAIDITKNVKEKIKPGRYTCRNLKEILQTVYDSCGYNQTAKATDIYDFYPNSAQPVASRDGKYINVK